MSGVDEIVLGFDPMDLVHAEFQEHLSKALRSSDQELPSHIRVLTEHLLSHFSAENKWMHESEYPSRECHLNEHAAVLRSAEEVGPLVANGNLIVGKAFLRALAQWFPEHAHHLDSALAAWMAKRRFGGSPVVVRRNASNQGAESSVDR